MSIFLAAVSADQRTASEINATDAVDYLPLQPRHASLHTLHDDRIGVRVFRYGAALDREPLIRGSDLCHVVGLPFSSTDDCRATILDRSGNPMGLNETIDGDHCSLVVRDGQMIGINGYSGEHVIYYRHLGRTSLLSNRLSVLAAFGPDLALDEIAGSYLAGQGYIYGRRTAFKGIGRLLPGDVVRADSDGITVERARIAGFYAPIAPRHMRDEIEHGVDRLVARCSFISDHYAEKAVVPLSGGKDSRAILAAMCASGRRPAFRKIYTNGHHYSPEVIAATAVIDMLGLERHRVRVPPLIPTANDLAQRALLSILSFEGQSSLFDWGGIARTLEVSIGGHRNCLRENQFPGYPEPAPETGAGIAAAIEAAKAVNPHALLTEDAADAARADLAALSDGFLADGMSPSKVPETFAWMLRNGGWVAPTNNSLTFGASPVHPLLGRHLMPLSMGLPSTILLSEIIHFRTMARADVPVWDVPFAGQVWSDRLPAVLDDLRYEGPRPRATAPFRSHKAFPRAAHAAVTNEKLVQFHMLSRFCGEAYAGIRETVPWLDPAMMGITTREDPHGAMMRLIAQNGAFTSILCATFGRDIFRRSQHARIKAELERFAEASTPRVFDEVVELRAALVRQKQALAEFVTAKHAMKRRSVAGLLHAATGRDVFRRSRRARVKAELKQLVRSLAPDDAEDIAALRAAHIRYEQAIAAFVREAQAVDAPPPPKPEIAPVQTGGWRFLEVFNETPAPVAYVLALPEGRSMKPRRVEAGGHFSQGLKGIGPFEFVCDTGTGTVRSTVAFKPGVYVQKLVVHQPETSERNLPQPRWETASAAP